MKKSRETRLDEMPYYFGNRCFQRYIQSEAHIIHSAILAELGIELGQFEEEERGGLILDEHQNVLQLLGRNDYRHDYDETSYYHYKKRQQLVD